MVARRLRAVVLAIVTAVGFAGGGAVAQSNTHRPFDHRRHEAVSCRSCHGTGQQHRAIFVRTARDCAACHHAAEPVARCANCHSPEQLRSVRTVEAPVVLAMRPEPRQRVLPFAHDRHEAVGCTECHATQVTLERSRTCSSCHDRHHRASNNCSACHERPPAAPHPAESHLSCSDVQCHAPRSTPDPAASRSLCLVCHREQEAHRAGGACATCHQVPGAEVSAALRSERP